MTGAPYRCRMGRTTVDVDDELVAAVMARYRLRTMREAVDLALRRALRRPDTHERLAGLDGIGFGAALDDVRPGDTDDA